MQTLVTKRLLFILALVSLAALIAFPVPAARPPASTVSSPFVDVHTHPEAGEIERSVKAALAALKTENAAHIILMPPPFTNGDPGRYEADVILPRIKGHEDKLTVLGGGGTLNAMIHESVKSGDAGPAIRQKFRQQAEDLLRAGAMGFGEMASEHFAGATAYQSAPPDHPLFLLLADIAAEHRVPIDLHMEAVPQTMLWPTEFKAPSNPLELRANIPGFERLLRHNPKALIIWAHAGADNTGYRTTELCRRLLALHPNLYMELKIDPAKPGKNPILSNGADGAIKPEWLKLFQELPNRFVVGTDQHYPEPKADVQRWQAMIGLLNQLPPELRKKVGYENATRLYFGE